MKQVKYFCDVCEKETNSKTTTMQVILTSVDTYGTELDRFFSNEELHICEACISKALKEGKYIKIRKVL